MNLYLKAVGVWVAFDGFVSLTYFAWVDGTLKNKADQSIRVIRILCGIAVAIFA